MKRVLAGFLAAIIAIGLSVSVAEAQKKKKKGGKGRAEAAAPESPKIAEAMGKLKWGMSREDVLKDAVTQIKEKYRPLLAKTKDAVEEDRLRNEERDTIDAVKKSVVEFDGRSSGWDIGFLKGEFTHNNDESMFVVKDGNSQNFYFFIGGKLWKWYKAFDASAFKGGNFATFAGAVTGKFGAGKESKGEVQPGEGQRQFIEWQDESTRLRAIDQTGFFGFYCLVFEDKGTIENLARLRSNVSEDRSEKKHALVEAVTGERANDPDDSPNIADRITGRIRQREQAPEPGSDETASSGKKGKGKGKDAKSSGSSVNSSDDPISGLGL